MDAAESADNRKSDGRFGPGNCANPGGRPKMSPEVRADWQALADKCLAKCKEIADRDDIRPETLIKLTEVAADRGYGKPAQALEITPPDGGKVSFEFVDAPSKDTDNERAKQDDT